jgi:hypothetical protein
MLACVILVWLFSPFINKMLILPRQARDKHRENSKKAGMMGAGLFIDDNWNAKGLTEEGE